MQKKHISLTAILICISLVASLLGIMPINASAVSDSEIVYAAEEIIIASEGDYGAINANDNGALSIGKVQWHATRALDLLKMIINKNASQALSILGEALYNEILSSTSWESRPLTSSESTVVSKLLTTPEGIEAQDELAYNDILSYVNSAKALGITDPGAIIYFCDVNNQHGLSAAKRVAASAAKSAGSYSAITPAIIHTAALTDSSAGKYPTRRQKVYDYVIALDWNSVSTDIELGVPYPRPQSDISASSSGDDIRWLQSALNKLASYTLSVNGSFNSATSSSYSDFEKTYHLKADGICSSSEIEHIADLLYIAANPKAASYYTVTTNGGNLNLRSSASTSGSVLAKIPNGTEIAVYSIEGTWAYVDFNGIKGYCSSEWITYSFDNYITSLSIKSYPKTVYSFGENFNMSELILKVSYYSGDYEYVTSGFGVYGSTRALGESQVKITYQSFEVSFTINVIDEITGIEVVNIPQTEFYYGDTLNTAGMYVKVSYNSGAYENKYSGYTLSCDMTKIGSQTVIVSYGGYTDEYNIYISDKLNSISIATMPKTKYFLGQDFDSSNLSLELKYYSGSIKYITAGFDILNYDTNLIGSSTVLIEYHNFKTQYEIFTAMPGDTNLNGKTESFDALLMLQESAGLVDLSENQKFAADPNSDGVIDSADALAVLYYLTYSTAQVE